MISSRMVRQVGSMGGEIKGLVPESLRERIAHRLKNLHEIS